MALQLEIKQTSSVPLEVEGVLPTVCQDKTRSEIEKLPIFHGNRELPLAEFFHVRGDPGDACIHWQGNLSGVHWIGAKMTSGQMTVHGDAGRHIGSEMSGGEIRILGNASDWVGGELRGGLIHVQGSAGHLIGAAYRGSQRGMTGGTILIQGNVGNEIGHSMRRGLLAVGGNCGDLAGFNMLAGTILVFGNSGIRHGAGMLRGTIGLLGEERPPLLPTFRGGSRGRPLAVALLWKELTRLDFAVPDRLRHCDFEIYHGDLLTGGRGEILLAAA
jgi:formylmethanofuran dehydrogenase subunit C